MVPFCLLHTKKSSWNDLPSCGAVASRPLVFARGQVGWYENNFWVREGLLNADLFTSYAGIYGLNDVCCKNAVPPRGCSRLFLALCLMRPFGSSCDPTLSLRSP